MIGGLRMQRSGIPLLILAAILLVAAGLVVFFRFDPFHWLANEPPPLPPEAPMSDAPAIEPAPTEIAESPADDATPPADEQRPADSPMSQPSSRTIQRGDTLSDIAGEVWNSTYLWPALLAANRDAIGNPDLLKPGQTIVVPPNPKAGGVVDPSLLSAHVLAYSRYRDYGAQAIAHAKQLGNSWVLSVGKRLENKALWVLYSGLRYDPGYVDDYASEIDPADRQTVAGFVDRFGLPTSK